MKTNYIILITLGLILSSCASDVVSINGTELSDIDHLLKTPSADGRPQLSFCLLKGTSNVAYGERNRSVESAEYYAKRLPELIKKDQPFQSLEIVGDSETSNCDVLLSPYIFIYITPMQHPEYDVGIGVPRPENPKSLIYWGYARKKDTFEQAVWYAGRYAYNAFAPGTDLYNRFMAQKSSKKVSFEDIAKKYREQTIKPELSEEARKYKVQAESAVKRKEFEIADARYSEALKIAPWWPQGHFNRALILGETERYQSAIDEMNKYLLLVPDAPDGRAAKDKIYEWEDLAKRAK